MAFTLPDLPYAKTAFGDDMSAETFDYHHGKHHNAYVTKANELVAADPALQGKSLVELIKSSKGGLFNQVGQIWNHSFFWLGLSPEKQEPTGKLADLIKAGDFMTQNKTNSFASKEVAYALLSRVYLYMEENAKAIEYADKVINSGRYNLLSAGEYPTYFRGVPDGNKETIFCIRHIKTEDRGFNAIGSMYFSGDASGNPLNQAASGWGEIYASKKLYDALNANPQDLRLKFISPLIENGAVKLNNKITPNVPMYYINKYNLQEGIVNLSSPVYLRLAEMYLNRAEANAKLGNGQLALDDVNRIRTRAGIGTLTLAGLVTANKSVLDAVLDERWFELSFEGHRAYDLFRNNRPITRNYPGTGTSTNQTVQPGDSKVVAFIPQTEIDKNPALTQNP